MTSQQAVNPPGEKRRDLLRAFYFPVSWLFFVPIFSTLTAFFGSIGICLAYLAPRFNEWPANVWARLSCKVNFTSVTVSGKEHIQTGQTYVIMSNHQSHFDVLALYGHIGILIRWVIKMELKKIPFIGGYTYRMGHMFVDRSNRERALSCLEQGKKRLPPRASIIFFPEGTRSSNGQLRNFKKGGFHLALDMGLPILPVSISGSHKVLPGKSFKLLPGRIKITVHPPVETGKYDKNNIEELVHVTREAVKTALTPWERGEST
jgi:1-acyl-sn-glycerol-3-phosphate acyltransferase